MPNKHRFQVFLEETQLATLRRMQAQSGAPVAAQIRMAVDFWIAKHGATTKSATKKKNVMPDVEPWIAELPTWAEAYEFALAQDAKIRAGHDVVTDAGRDKEPTDG